MSLRAATVLLTAIQANRLDDIEDLDGLLKKALTRRRLLFRPIERPKLPWSRLTWASVSAKSSRFSRRHWTTNRGSATLPVQLVAVEHPELNLHPRLQAEIADAFLEGALAEATRGRIFFIETHSEVFTLRLFRRLRESHRKRGGLDIGPLKGDGSGGFDTIVKPTDVAVWYVDRSSGVVKVNQILVDVEGQLVDPWPDDDSLFEQDFRERYA